MKKTIFNLLDFSNENLKDIKRLYESNEINKAKVEFLKYIKTRNFKGFIGGGKSNLYGLIKNNYKDEFEDIEKIADDFVNGVIKFNMKWDMERCHKEYKFHGKIDWLVVPFEDVEWTYMLNRHKHFICYGEAYLINGEKKYLEKFKSEIINWIDTITLSYDTNLLAWRTIECGIRLRNWTKALEYFIDDLDFETLEKIIISMDEQIEYIIQESREDRFLSNWVILENNGVLIASIFLNELKFSKERLEFSIKYITKALEMQILNDGMHWEQSYMYHNEMINCILSIIMIAKRNGVEIPRIFSEKVEKMVSATQGVMQPNYMQPNYGDSDVEDVRDILGFAAVVLKQGIFKYNVDKLPIDVVFDVGIEEVEEFLNLKVEETKFTSVAFEKCGNYIIRDKQGEDGIFTLFKCGHLGSGHGHFDLLHFSINYKGNDILVDSGRYNYSEKCEYRIFLKEAKSHNTFILDDMEFNTAKGSWGTQKVAEAIKREYHFGEVASFVEGAHLGYIMQGTFVDRKIIFINKGIWILSDEIRCNKNHKYSAFFNFNSDDAIIENDFIIYNFLNKQKKNRFFVKMLDGQTARLEKSYLSEEYNKIRNSKKAIVEKNITKDSSINYVMYSDDIHKIDYIKFVEVKNWQGKAISDEYVKAIKIKMADDIYIVVIVSKEEPSGRKTYTVEGIQVYGRVVVIRKKEDKSFIEVLAY